MIFLHAKTKPDYGFLKLKLNISSPVMLRERLLEHCKTLDFNEISRDVEPFLFNAKDTNRILLFPEFVAEAVW